MIRELIVVGLYDQKLSEKLQLDPKFCLTKRINQARQSEAVKKRQALLRNDFQDVEDSKKKKSVDAVKEKQRTLQNSRIRNRRRRNRLISLHRHAANTAGIPRLTS